MNNFEAAKASFPKPTTPEPTGQAVRFPEIDTSKFFEPLPESELSAWECQS